MEAILDDLTTDEVVHDGQIDDAWLVLEAELVVMSEEEAVHVKHDEVDRDSIEAADLPVEETGTEDSPDDDTVLVEVAVQVGHNDVEDAASGVVASVLKNGAEVEVPEAEEILEDTPVMDSSPEDTSEADDLLVDDPEVIIDENVEEDDDAELPLNGERVQVGQID